MNKDLISIIIPVYNAERYIEETINTVIMQTYENWELIIVNDCSTDKTKDVIEKFIIDNKKKLENKVNLINLKENVGVSKARNTGVDSANGRYIAFLDGDDLWDKEKLKKQIEFMNEKKCAFSYTGYEFANENGEPTGKKVQVPEIITYKNALKNTIISTITVMIDITMVNKEYIYMPIAEVGEDTLTWWNILKKCNKGYGINEVLSLYRRTKNTLSSKKVKNIIKVWNIYNTQKEVPFIYRVYCFIIRNIKAVLRRL